MKAVINVLCPPKAVSKGYRFTNRVSKPTFDRPTKFSHSANWILDPAVKTPITQFFDLIAFVLNHLLIKKSLSSQERLCLRNLVLSLAGFVHHLLIILLDWIAIPSTVENDEVWPIYSTISLRA